MKTLYKKNKNGSIQEYSCEADGKVINSIFGQVGGAMQESSLICIGKNIGRSNETTPEEQAVLEAASKLQLKRDKGYFDSIQEANTEEVFLPMLATALKKVKNLQYPVDVQPKFDGVRCLASYKNGSYDLMSRGGKDYDVEHISKELLEYGSDTIVFDGELYIHGMPLQDIVSLVKKPKPGSENIEFWIYDVYLRDNKTMTWKKREALLDAFKNRPFGFRGDSPHIKFSPNHTATSKSEMKEHHNRFVENGYEGLIIREFHGVYELGHRSRNLIKYKEFDETEFEIVGFTEGKGKFEGCVIWTCEIADQGATFDVVPKGTLEQKAIWYDNGDDYEGKMLTVRHMGYSKDGIPQHVVGIAIRDYE